jgi:hypothetical protein
MGKEVISLNSDIILLNENIGEIVNLANDNFLLRGKISGIIGLAFSETSLYKKTFFDSLIQSGLLMRNVISFYYHGKEKGEINFGYVDSNKFKGNLNQHKVIEKYYWSIKLDDVRIGDKNLQLCNNDCKAVLDTGATSISMPSQFIEEIEKNIKIEQDCSNMDKLPSITFLIDKIQYLIYPKSYVFIYTNNGKSQCLLNLLPAPELPNSKEGHTFILGEIFINNFYTVFDRDQDSIHLGIINI